MSTPPPARCHIGAEWNDGQGVGLHLSGLNRTASPASYPQHGFVFQPIGCPFRVMRVRIPSKHDGSSGHMRNAGFRMGAVCGRWHEPVAGQAFLCSHGPSAVPHAGTVPAVPHAPEPVPAVVAQLQSSALVMRRSPVRIRSMALSPLKTDLFFLLCLAGFSGSLQPDRRGGFRYRCRSSAGRAAAL